MEEREENGISLADIFRIIFSQKWLLLILTVVIAAASTVGVYLYGKSKLNYSVSFVLQLPNTSGSTSTTYYYPDGESFYFTDIISQSRLEDAAKENNLNIDVKSLVAKNAISITRNVDKIDSDTKEGVYDLNYVLKVSAGFFTNEDDAAKFIQTLINYPQKYIATMDINYDKSLTTSKNAVTFGEQLNQLQNQVVYLRELYANLITGNGGEFTLKDGRTLTQCKDEIDTFLNKQLFLALSNKAQENGYIKSNNDEKNLLLSDLYDYEKKLQVVTDTLNEFKQAISGSTQSIVYDKIIELNREIATLKQNKEITQRYLDSYNDATKVAPADYVAEVKALEDAVAKFTNDIKPVASYVYEKVTKVKYLNAKIVSSEGGFGLPMSGAVGVVLGLIVGMVTAYIVGKVKLSKVGVEKNASNLGTTVSRYSDAQLQIAVTSEEDKKDDKK